MAAEGTAWARLRPLVVLGTLVLVVAVLHAARPVLIPLALALLLAFLLNPLVRIVQRWRVPRLAAVLLVVALGFSVLGVLSYAVASQVIDLAGNLSKYEANIRDKVRDIWAAGPQVSLFGKVKQTMEK